MQLREVVEDDRDLRRIGSVEFLIQLQSAFVERLGFGVFALKSERQCQAVKAVGEGAVLVLSVVGFLDCGAEQPFGLGILGTFDRQVSAVVVRLP
jgi:hypothetical protein